MEVSNTLTQFELASKMLAPFLDTIGKLVKQMYGLLAW